MRWLAVALLALSLGACDDSPAVRQNLAQCQMSPEAKDKSGGWNDAYLEICMQARGYRLDDLAKTCNNFGYPAIEASCYRRDDWFSEMVAKLTPKTGH